MKAQHRLFIIAPVVLIVGSLVMLAVVLIDPRYIWGILRYDQRREDVLEIGDKAPDAVLTELQGGEFIHLEQAMGRRPLVLIFGSYT
jgi:hypothetical protein